MSRKNTLQSIFSSVSLVSVLGVFAGCFGADGSNMTQCATGMTVCGDQCIAADSVCPSSDARLAKFDASEGRLSPAFSPDVTTYTLQVPACQDTVELRATSQAAGARLTLDGAWIGDGSGSGQVKIGPSLTMAQVTVTGPSGATQSYTIMISRMPASDYIKASNTGRDDQFGHSISMSEDLLAVGAPYEDSDSTGINGPQSDAADSNIGAVYIFQRTPGGWVQKAYLKPSNHQPGGHNFGWSVSLHGDTLAVGAPREQSATRGINGDQDNSSAIDAGAVYVFARTGDTWTQQAYLKASNAEAQDLFGRSVSLHGDTLAVGADHESSSARGIDGNQDDNGANASGAVYVFQRSDSTWTQQAYLKASNAEAQDLFGNSIALHEDTLVVGAPQEDSSALGIDGNQGDNGAAQRGAVYVFARTAGSWMQQAYVKSYDAAPASMFGRSVAFHGDTLAVGADSKAYVFTRTGTSFAQHAALSATTPVEGFGAHVALFEDTLAVTADTDDTDALSCSESSGQRAQNSGAVHLYKRSGVSFIKQTYLKAANTEAGDRFGTSVALSRESMVVGAPFEAGGARGINGSLLSNSIANSGAVYAFAPLSVLY